MKLIACPNKYNRDPTHCKLFLLQSLLFLTILCTLTDKEKVPEFINLLTDKALLWALAVWEARYDALASFEHFKELFHLVLSTLPRKMRRVSVC